MKIESYLEKLERERLEEIRTVAKAQIEFHIMRAKEIAAANNLKEFANESYKERL